MSANSLNTISKRIQAPVGRLRKRYQDNGGSKTRGDKDIEALQSAYEDVRDERQKLLRVLRMCVKAEQETTPEDTLCLLLDMAYCGFDSDESYVSEGTNDNVDSDL
jgi:hypothetical protein